MESLENMKLLYAVMYFIYASHLYKQFILDDWL